MTKLPLGDALRLARESREWTLRTASAHSGVHHAHICQIETGSIRQPGMAVLAGLSAAYGIPLRDLVTLAGEQGPGTAMVLSAHATAVLSQMLPRLHGRWQVMCDRLITHIAEHAEEIDTAPEGSRSP